jgi:hypothetical protein
MWVIEMYSLNCVLKFLNIFITGKYLIRKFKYISVTAGVMENFEELPALLKTRVASNILVLSFGI